MPNHSLNPNNPRILVIRIGALGDVLHTLPMLARLREHVPQAHIGWLVGEAARPLLEDHPMIDALHTFKGLKWHTREALSACIKELRAQHYDIVIDTQGLFKSGLMSWLSGAPRRIGLKNARELAPLFYTETVDTGPLKAPDKVVWQHYLELLAGLTTTMPSLSIPPQQPQFPLPAINASNIVSSLPEALNDALEENAPIIGMAPLTAWASKNWPLSYWQDLIHQTLSTHETAHIVLLGAPHETAQFDTLKTQASESHRVHIPALTLKQLPALVKQLHVVIGGDSFPLHLAGALGVPVIGLYGPTSAQRTPPPQSTGPQALLHLTPQLTCQPCHQKTCRISTHDCLTQLSPDSAWKALNVSLAKHGQVDRAIN